MTLPNSTPLFEIPEQLLVHKQDNLYTTTAHQFIEFNQLYKQFLLPNDILFPWLHGVDGFSNQQNLFFGVRRSLVPNYRGLMVIHCQEFENRSRLIETVLPQQVISMEPPHQHEFISTYNRELQINLRNFKSQVSRFSTICDIVLYGKHAPEVAIALAAAQQKLHKERMAQIESVQKSAGKRAIANANTITYKTIIIQDDFSIFERNYPELVMWDSTGLIMQTRDFFELESKQMREMSKATEITEHIWIGNTQDAPVSTYDIFSSGSSFSDFGHEEDTNPNHFSICIESHDLADMPLPSTLTLARETLNDLKDGQMPSEMIHFDMYATGVSNEKAEFDTFFGHLKHLMMFMEDQISHGRRILIHCSDGYTESSLLGLSWIMYHLKLPLPEAYLYLQKKRSFFVYAADLPTLRRIEQLLFDDQDSLEPGPKRRKSMTGSIEKLIVRRPFDSDEDDDQEMVDIGSPIAHKDPQHRVLHNDAYINTVSNFVHSNDVGATLPSTKAYQRLQLSPTKEEERQYPWFYSPRFEGSFPSRISPFLYLGNLNHATNPEMLKALNITHVVSVGENASLSKQDFELLFLDNLYDDGIDTIRSRLDQVMDFVEDARLKGTTCLIHCRVGVSRSAAITICYIMKHFHLTLVEAYLFVRARRLNVIIQPNLKFMYELLQLEQTENGTLTITWPILCSEIHNLNFGQSALSDDSE